MGLVVGSLYFENKTQLKKYASKVKDKYQIGADVSAEDTPFLKDLIQRHPYPNEKIKCGIAKFRVDLDGYGNKQFRLVRIDGTETDFSYIRCANGYTRILGIEKFMRAARLSINPQIMDYKRQYFYSCSEDGTTAPCEATGKTMGWHDADIHHVTPFKEIAEKFLDENGIDPDAISYKMGSDNHVGIEFADLFTQTAFQQYHAKHAKLMCVLREVHTCKGIKKV